MRIEKEEGIEFKIQEIKYPDIVFITRWKIKLFYQLFIKARCAENYYFSYRYIFNPTKIIEVSHPIKKKGKVKL